jgi:glycosyltransferase involved in cell wall biosynthesis
MGNTVAELFPFVSVILPARNEAANIANVIEAILLQTPAGGKLEVILADDGSTDNTVAVSRAAGARVIEAGLPESQGNPAAARNRGAAAASGDPLIFLDADCVVGEGWLHAILAAHARGETVVGGSLDLPAGLPVTARCDYYCGWYVVHSGRPAGYVPHQPAPNLSVRREVFFDSAGFEELPFFYACEERAWQAELRAKGHRIYFEPRAVAYHYNRPGFRNLLSRNYRWGYTAIESKHKTGSARLAWLYRYPRLLIVASLPLAFAHTAYILACWARAGVFEPVVMLPLVLVSRFAYSTGMMVGGIEWLRHGRSSSLAQRPQPKGW